MKAVQRSRTNIYDISCNINVIDLDIALCNIITNVFTPDFSLSENVAFIPKSDIGEIQVLNFDKKRRLFFVFFGFTGAENDV